MGCWKKETNGRKTLKLKIPLIVNPFYRVHKQHKKKKKTEDEGDDTKKKVSKTKLYI